MFRELGFLKDILSNISLQDSACLTQHYVARQRLHAKQENSTLVPMQHILRKSLRQGHKRIQKMSVKLL